MKFKLVYVVHFLILILAVYVFTTGLLDFFEYLKFRTFEENSFKSTLEVFNQAHRLHAIIFICFPVIGVFLKNKFGWVFVSSYIYIMICSAVLYAYHSQYNDYLFNGLMIFILLLFVLIMNFRSSIDYYRIKRTQLISLGVIAFVAGLSFSLVLFFNRLLF